MVEPDFSFDLNGEQQVRAANVGSNFTQIYIEKMNGLREQLRTDMHEDF